MADDGAGAVVGYFGQRVDQHQRPVVRPLAVDVNLVQSVGRHHLGVLEKLDVSDKGWQWPRITSRLDLKQE